MKRILAWSIPMLLVVAIVAGLAFGAVGCGGDDSSEVSVGSGNADDLFKKFTVSTPYGDMFCLVFNTGMVGDCWPVAELEANR